jgi:hypothetical protein
MYDFDDNECRLNHNCELGDRHKGPCKQYIQHDALCGCNDCARDCENGSDMPRFECREL